MTLLAVLILVIVTSILAGSAALPGFVATIWQPGRTRRRPWPTLSGRSAQGLWPTPPFRGRDGWWQSG